VTKRKPDDKKASIWTDELTDWLKREWKRGGGTATGLAAVLSRELGVLVTRNAIIGKVHRLGLGEGVRSINGRPGPVPKPKPKPVPYAGKPSPAVKGVGKLTGYKSAPDEVREERAAAGQAVIAAAEAAPPPERVLVPFLEAGLSQCRNIVGPVKSIETMFCGQPTEGESSWCPECRKVNVTASVPRGLRLPSKMSGF